MKPGYDLIGDIHGQFDLLAASLRALGYEKRGSAFRHPEGRQAVFVGDLVDRGPAQEDVLATVRSMIEAGSARAVMGNHEWNAIGYLNGWRLRNEKNTSQHRAFLDQIGCDSPKHKAWVDWLKTLPPFLELDGARVCHAWWSDADIARLRAVCRADGALTEDFLQASCIKGSEARGAMEAVLCGLETTLPDGVKFTCHSGKKRSEVRLRWWAPEADTYRKSAIVPDDDVHRIPDTPLPDHLRLPRPSVPTFVGHYWASGVPQVQNDKVAVLDFGAAAGGPLVAYRWDGETELSSHKLVAVGGR